MAEIEDISKKIKVQSITVRELFAKKLAVPEYQRPYVWQLKDIEKLLYQIKVHNDNKKNNKPMFYLGSIVLHEDADGNLNIIDGQQRITTLALIDYINGSSELEIKYDNLITQQNIRDNHQQLSTITKITEILTEVNLDEINVTVIVTQSQDDAYNFFETLNTGGKRLSGIDIIKAHHLRSVEPNKINSYAIAWEKEQHYMEDVTKLLLKARKWNILNFEDILIPSRKSGLKEWKEIITDEFSVKTLKNNLDTSYSYLKMEGNKLELLGNKYNVRQPLSDGQNFINYLISYIDLYKQLFVFSKDCENDFYCCFTTKIINVIDGTIDLKPLYQLALLCFVSRFGLNRRTEVSLWIFRFVYSIRLSVAMRVQEATAITHLKKGKLVDRILSCHTEEELLSWLQQEKYTLNEEHMTGVKGRYVARVKTFFQIESNSNFVDFDNQLIQKIKSQKNQH